MIRFSTQEQKHAVRSTHVFPELCRPMMRFTSPNSTLTFCNGPKFCITICLISYMHFRKNTKKISEDAHRGTQIGNQNQNKVVLKRQYKTSTAFGTVTPKSSLRPLLSINQKFLWHPQCLFCRLRAVCSDTMIALEQKLRSISKKSTVHLLISSTTILFIIHAPTGISSP